MLNAYKRQNEKIMGCDMSMNVKEIRFVFKSYKNCFGTRNLNSWKILSIPFHVNTIHKYEILKWVCRIKIRLYVELVQNYIVKMLYWQYHQNDFEVKTEQCHPLIYL